MKYLKLFEGFSKDEYYTEIPYHEYKKLVNDYSGTSEPLQQTTRLDIVDEFYKLKTKLGYHVEMNLSHDRLSIWGNTYKGSKGTTKWEYSICKLDDGWYFYSEIRSYRGVYTHYKCDQWEGLLELLKDKEFLK